MPRPHAAAIFEDAWNRQVAGAMRRRGWGTRVLAHTGYGSTDRIRVLGRVLMTRRPYAPAAADARATWLELRTADNERRGWRVFFTTAAPGEPVTVTIGEREFRTRVDRSGLLDLTITDHGLKPGWHDLSISSPRAADTTAAVFVVAPGETFGIVSDIDDTIITTTMPRPMIAAWNTFFRHEGTRRAVPGMATMYRELLAEHPSAPIVYVSTGAWNLVPALTRFLRRAGYPLGPMLMTDWGPTNTGWFRSGQDHKRAALHRLARELPEVRWVLIGDDGQHDPSLYGEFAEQLPERVRAIGIRVLSTTEQLLSHFTPISTDDFEQHVGVELPICRANDGWTMLEQMREALGTDRARA
ncbi:App1 family protein [Janibacter indicus]|uniref:App1 family protein n=1 Tax=Janibacter indicus TaxID=857417 RepID=UPI003D9A9FC2